MSLFRHCAVSDRAQDDLQQWAMIGAAAVPRSMW
jgi:hypothetical protein